MRDTHDCEGVSIRQHNEPAGNQDVWHLPVHLHTPGGEEEFYRTASETSRTGRPPTLVDFDQVKQAAMATGSLRVVGPPPFHPAKEAIGPPAMSPVT
jgi:hypothetical protein